MRKNKTILFFAEAMKGTVTFHSRESLTIEEIVKVQEFVYLKLKLKSACS